jgi:hypothetical protein
MATTKPTASLLADKSSFDHPSKTRHFKLPPGMYPSDIDEMQPRV